MEKGKILIVSGIFIFFLILIIFAWFLFFQKNEISMGAGIKSVYIKNEKIMIALDEIGDDIKEIKFIIKDAKSKRYSYNTDIIRTVYEMSASDFGLDDIDYIEKISAVFIYDVPEEIFEKEFFINDSACKLDSDCDDNIECTRDICIAGKCEFAPDNSCDDGNFCNGLEYCALGIGCRNSAAVDCSYLNDRCNQGICSEANKSCVKVPVLNGNTCNDNQNCTSNDICSDGFCIGTTNHSVCEDGIACTLNECKNETCITTQRNSFCGNLEFCTSTGCVQSACKGCEDCNSFYSDCNKDKCTQNCNRFTSCYFYEPSGRCNNLSFTCFNIIKNCSDYSFSECSRDVCNLGCRLENNLCVKRINCTALSCSSFTQQQCINNPCNMNCMLNGNFCTEYQALCSPWPKGTGFYKDLWIDGGVSLVQRSPTKTIDFLKLTTDKLMTSDSSVQQSAVVGNTEDKNGVLLYPDDYPRYRIVFVNGGSSTSHGSSLKEEGRNRFRTYFNNGGSYTGSCAGAFLATSWADSYFKLWPGEPAGSGPMMVFLPYEFKETDNLMVQKYYEFAKKYTSDRVYEYNGPLWTKSQNPPGTLYLGEIKSGTMSGTPPILTYKIKNESGRVVVGTGHPEDEFNQENIYLMAAMFLYAMDGNPNMPPLKSILQNNQEIVVNTDNTKIGEKQYHRYKFQLPSGTHSLTITLTSLSDNVELYVSRGCPCYKDNAQYKSENPGSQNEIITINNPGGAEYHVSVAGNHNRANGASYTLKASWN